MANLYIAIIATLLALISIFKRRAARLGPSQRTSAKWGDWSSVPKVVSFLALVLAVPMLGMGLRVGMRHRQAKRSSYRGDPDESGAERVLLLTLSAASAAIVLPAFDLALYVHSTLHFAYTIVISIVMMAFYFVSIVYFLAWTAEFEPLGIYEGWRGVPWDLVGLAVLYCAMFVLYISYLSGAMEAMEASGNRGTGGIAAQDTQLPLLDESDGEDTTGGMVESQAPSTASLFPMVERLREHYNFRQRSRFRQSRADV